jgi:hypothetical protein
MKFNCITPIPTQWPNYYNYADRCINIQQLIYCMKVWKYCTIQCARPRLCAFTHIVPIYIQHSLSAHHASEFTAISVGGTVYAMASHFGKVEKGSIYICSTTRNWFWICIHTHVGCSMVTMVIWHEVTNILPCPGWWARYHARDHDLVPSFWSMAQNTGSIVIKHAIKCFVLCSIQQGTWILLPRCNFEELWFVWQTEVVWTASFVSMVWSSCNSRIYYTSSLSVRTGSSSPANVVYSTGGSRGNCTTTTTTITKVLQCLTPWMSKICNKNMSHTF